MNIYKKQVGIEVTQQVKPFTLWSFVKEIRVFPLKNEDSMWKES